MASMIPMVLVMSHRGDLSEFNARGAGVEKGIEMRTQEELERAVDRILEEDGPVIVVVKIDKGPSTAPFDQDLIGQASRFRKALAALPAA
jgi:thiamine pyrophosphate-dependent acetolactate synthase large subunit-like protein